MWETCRTCNVTVWRQTRGRYTKAQLNSISKKACEKDHTEKNICGSVEKK